MTQMQSKPTPVNWQRADGGLLPLAAAHVARMASAGVTATAAHKSALNVLAAAVLAIGPAKFVSLWPFIGGTAATHALDLMAAHDLTWFGTSTHNANGVTGNGTTGYAKTGLLSSDLAESDGHLASYMGTTAPGGSQCTIGAIETSDRYCILGWLSSGTKEAGVIQGKLVEYAPAIASPAATGFLAVSATAGRSNQFYTAAGALGSPTVPTAVAQDRELYVNALNNVGTAGVFCSRRVQFISAGKGLDSAAVVTLRAAVARAQTILGRAV